MYSRRGRRKYFKRRSPQLYFGLRLFVGPYLLSALWRFNKTTRGYSKLGHRRAYTTTYIARLRCETTYKNRTYLSLYYNESPLLPSFGTMKTNIRKRSFYWLKSANRWRFKRFYGKTGHKTGAGSHIQTLGEWDAGGLFRNYTCLYLFSRAKNNR